MHQVEIALIQPITAGGRFEVDDLYKEGCWY